MTNEHHRCEQTEILIRKLGGVSRVAEAIRTLSRVGEADRRAYNLHPSTVYRWTLPAAMGGTGGTIPAKYWPAVISLGREVGVVVQIADLSPAVAHALQEGNA